MYESETLRVGIALMTSKVMREKIDFDKEMTLMVERFRRFMKSHKKKMTSKEKEEMKMTLLKKGDKSKDKSSRIDEQCLKCDGFGHIASMCSNLKYKKEGDVMIASWSDSEV